MAEINKLPQLVKQNPHKKKTTTTTMHLTDSINGGVEQIDLPIIDYSLLKSEDPAQRSLANQKLGEACLHYGCFMIMNIGMPDTLIKSVINGFYEFFDLKEEEKCKYAGNSPTDQIRWAVDSREFIKFASHPQLHCPSQPLELREALAEYNKTLREVGLELLRGISKTLMQEESYIEKTMKMDTGFDFYTANDYPPSSNSSDGKQVGQLAHTDPDVINLIMQDTTGGLQLEHKAKWVHVNFNPDYIFAALGDHLEILTNGKYKSLLHRVMVNNKVRRLSLPLFIGPSLDAFVKPAPEFVDHHHPPAYRNMTYKQYLEANGYHIIDGKSCLKQIKL